MENMELDELYDLVNELGIAVQDTETSSINDLAAAVNTKFRDENARLDKICNEQASSSNAVPFLLQNKVDQPTTAQSSASADCYKRRALKELPISSLTKRFKPSIKDNVICHKPSKEIITVRPRAPAKSRLRKVADVESSNSTAPRPLPVRKDVQAEPNFITERRRSILEALRRSDRNQKRSGKNEGSEKTSVIKRYRKRLQQSYIGVKKSACTSTTRPFLPQHTGDRPTTSQPSTSQPSISLDAKSTPKQLGKRTSGLSTIGQASRPLGIQRDRRLPMMQCERQHDPDTPIEVLLYPGRTACIPREAITKKREYTVDLEDGQWHITFNEIGEVNTFEKLLD